MRWIRLLLSLILARFRSKLLVSETSTLDFHVWITDVDATVMNHASLLTVYEAGRIDLMVRTGFFGLARENRWFFPSTAIQARFFKPLKAFQKARVYTSILSMTDHYIYTLQKIYREDKLVSLCLAKSTVRKGKDYVDTGEILRQLNQNWDKENDREFLEAMESNVDFLDRFR